MIRDFQLDYLKEPRGLRDSGYLLVGPGNLRRVKRFLAEHRLHFDAKRKFAKIRPFSRKIFKVLTIISILSWSVRCMISRTANIPALDSDEKLPYGRIHKCVGRLPYTSRSLFVTVKSYRESSDVFYEYGHWNLTFSLKISGSLKSFSSSALYVPSIRNRRALQQNNPLNSNEILSNYLGYEDVSFKT